MAIRQYSRGIAFISVALLAMASPAEAQTMQAQTLGDVINNTVHSFANIPAVLSAVAYLFGLFFSITGVFKFKDHVDSPHNNPLSIAVKRFIAGGAMFSGPYMFNVLSGTLFGGGGQALAVSGHHGGQNLGGADQMIYNLVHNFAGPMTHLLTAFAYLSAIVLLLVGINRLTKTAQEGPRGPAGMGTIMTFLASGALFSFGGSMGTFSSSLFGSSTVSTYANIDPSVLDQSSALQVAPIIEAVMAFVMIVGYIAFIRGWFVLKAFADGHSNATLAQALTFLFGGAVAINLGALINVLEKTVGIAGITFT